jgi:hypothetical protein
MIPLAAQDLVALLVLEHQAKMLNLLTRVGWEARSARRSRAARSDQAAAELVDYLLFGRRGALPGPIAGTTKFAEVFSARVPRDSRGGRCATQLETRLLRYPCSYLIYSEPFDGMPAKAKAASMRGCGRILSGQERDQRYAVLTPRIGARSSRSSARQSRTPPASFAERKAANTYYPQPFLSRSRDDPVPRFSQSCATAVVAAHDRPQQNRRIPSQQLTVTDRGRDRSRRRRHEPLHLRRDRQIDEPDNPGEPRTRTRAGIARREISRPERVTAARPRLRNTSPPGTSSDEIAADHEDQRQRESRDGRR